MYPPVNKPKHVIESLKKLDTPAIPDEQADKIIVVNFPLSFLLLESEEDSFVKGYN